MSGGGTTRWQQSTPPPLVITRVAHPHTSSPALVDQGLVHVRSVARASPK